MEVRKRLGFLAVGGGGAAVPFSLGSSLIVEEALALLLNLDLFQVDGLFSDVGEVLLNCGDAGLHVVTPSGSVG